MKKATCFYCRKEFKFDSNKHASTRSPFSKKKLFLYFCENCDFFKNLVEYSFHTKEEIADLHEFYTFLETITQ